jgi:DNA invertase Pin-like site-specific DNA recombinase
MPKAIIYCRVSSDRQVREGHGLDGQEARCRKYAEVHGYAVAAVFRDEGVSGGVIDRAGMQAMLDYLDTQPAGQCVVVIDDIKRLARDLLGHFSLRKSITARGARLESPSHKFGDEPEEMFVESILAATAELERNQNRRQVKNRMRARLEAGYWPFYPPPGYTFAKVAGHGKMLVPKEPEATTVRQALEGFATGRFATQADVQRFLDERRFRPRGYGNGAYREGARRLLSQELYAGIVHLPVWEVSRRKGQHQPLVSPDTFERVQERLRDAQKSPQQRNLRSDFPLRSFVLCPGCRKPYTAAWSRGKRARFAYYRCIATGCAFCHKSVRAERMHAAFESLLATLRPRADLLDVVRKEFLEEWDRQKLDVEAVRKERQRKLDEIQGQINGYLEAVGRCTSPIMLKKIEEGIEALDAKRLRLGGSLGRSKEREYDFEHALAQVLDFLKEPALMWRTGDLEIRRVVLRLVFSEPLVYDRESGFGTPTFSLPINVSCALNLENKDVVELIRRDWNTLAEVIREWNAVISGLMFAKKPA